METRICKRCETERPLTDFNKTYMDVAKTARRWVCRPCQVAAVSEHVKKMRPEYAKKSVEKVWADVRAAYGGACACCGETEPDFLHVDHVRDDGSTHRAEMRPDAPKTWAGVTVYYWLRKNNFPEGFQLLCANCNLAKARKRGCPHVYKAVVDN